MQINSYKELKNIERELSWLGKKRVQKIKQIAQKKRELSKLQKDVQEIEKKLNGYFSIES
ncbi:MAG: hypothetical protein IE909_16425 [Campylobacterales bacterium]|nr:hypothetical protein [Campylobacterales bacterium]